MTDAGSRATILFVEDDTALREHIAAALADEFDIQTAADGEQALKLLPKIRPDLIVTDLLMPDLDGVEFVRLLRADPNTAAIPVLMISGGAPDELHLQGFELGADAHLAKPFTERELRAHIRGLLKANRLRTDSRRQEECMQRDVSAEKSAQQALKDSEERYRAFVANTSEGIWRFELDPPLDLTWNLEEQVEHIYRHGHLAELNDAMARMYGYERAEDLVGAPLAKTLPPGEDAYEYLRTIALAGYSLSNVESTETDRNGNLHYFSNSLTPIISGGKVLRAWGTQRDISDSKRAEQKLRENERHKDEFLAILAHELRNPLAPIRNGLQILRVRVSGDDVVERVVTMMDRQMTHLVRLVDDLLDVSRISSGRLELRLEPVLLRDALASAIDAASSLITANGHQLIVETESPDVLVKGDTSRLTQIFTNLLSNATKYTERGGTITLNLQCAGDEAVITVRDTGIGIPGSDLTRIFDMFSQVAAHRDRASGGLGIGLALVRKLVEMHHGSVAAQSAGPGLGSTFVVRLPLMQVEAKVDTGRREELAHLETPPRRVLVVDDNIDAAQSLAGILEIAGHEVRTAADGVQAVEATERFEPHVVFMDLGMPRMDGLEAARRIRQLPKGRDTMLVAVTGWGQLADRERTRDAGFDQHLVKPVSVEEVEKALASNASRHG